MSVSRGRGAWTAVGKDNGKRYYQYVEGLPLDGANGERDINYFAVREGVRAIQSRINDLWTGSSLITDGIFGPRTTAAVKTIQAHFSLGNDGVVGPTTAKKLWFGILDSVSKSSGVPFHHLAGILMHESLGDPGAVGSLTPGDRGPVQISTVYHPDLDEGALHDPTFALSWASSYLLNFRIRFSGKGSYLRSLCSIAAWNNPSKAQKTYDNSTAAAVRWADEQIEDYVTKVLDKGRTFND